MSRAAGLAPPVIRLARSEDAPAAARLEEANLGPDAWPSGLVAQGVAGQVPTTRWWVAQVEADPGEFGPGEFGPGEFGPGGAELCGHAVVSIAAEIAELQRISVTAAQRRTGLATALLAQVAAYSANEGAERMLLEVRVDNEAARAFYVARGFVELARRSRYYADGADAIVMELELIRPTEHPAGER